MLEKNNRKEGMKIIESPKELDLESSFEGNINYQIRLILNDFNLIGYADSITDLETLKNALNNDIRSFELLLVAYKKEYGDQKYRDELDVLSKEIQKEIKKIEGKKGLADEDKKRKIVDYHIDYLRKKFEVLVRIAQTERSEKTKYVYK